MALISCNKIKNNWANSVYFSIEVSVYIYIYLLFKNIKFFQKKEKPSSDCNAKPSWQ